MKKMLIAILSILNFLTTFLPYGLLSTGKNCFLWKWHKMDELLPERICEIVDSINTGTTIAIYITAILLMVSCAVYLVCDNKITAGIVKLIAVSSVCVNLFFCYHLYDYLVYKYVNIGVLLAIGLCVYIIILLSDFKKRSLLILGVAILLTFPAFIVRHQFDIEGSIYSIPYSVQMYFYTLYDNIKYGSDMWIHVIPSIVVIVITLVAVICAICNLRVRKMAVCLMIVGFVMAYRVDMQFALSGNYDIYLQYTYPLAVVMSLIYLLIDMRDKNTDKLLEK